MRNKVIGKFLGLALVAMALTILGTSSAMATVATGPTTITANIPTAASITVAGSVALGQGGGDTFTTDWTAASDTIYLSYRATKTSGSATLEVYAQAVSPSGGPALGNFFLTTTGWTGGTGSLNNSTSAQAFPSSNITIFTDTAGNHANGKSFTAAYKLVSGDYAAGSYSVLLTYTFTVD